LPCFFTLEFIDVAGYFGLAGGVAPLVGWNWHLHNEFQILLTGLNNQFQNWESWIFTNFFTLSDLEFLMQCFRWEGQEVRWRSRGQESTEGQVDQEIVESQETGSQRRARSLKHWNCLKELLVKKFVKIQIRILGILWVKYSTCSSDQTTNHERGIFWNPKTFPQRSQYRNPHSKKLEFNFKILLFPKILSV